MTQKFTTTEVNKTFKLKVFGTVDGKKVNSLYGVSGLIRIIGIDLFNKFCTRAFATYNADKCVCRLRRGLVVTFYTY